jgi:DNA-directed RNA polymerase subunit L
MRIFNQDKTIELTEYDLTLGYLQEDELVTITAEEASEDASSAEFDMVTEQDGKITTQIKSTVEYDGKNFIRTTVEKILVYIEYTEAELHKMAAEARIAELEQMLKDTDYLAIKNSEGCFTEEEYAPIKAQRQAWRDEINALEAEVA